MDKERWMAVVTALEDGCKMLETLNGMDLKVNQC
jgi:hypothetical protein